MPEPLTAVVWHAGSAFRNIFFTLNTCAISIHVEAEIEGGEEEGEVACTAEALLRKEESGEIRRLGCRICYRYRKYHTYLSIGLLISGVDLKPSPVPGEEGESISLEIEIERRRRDATRWRCRREGAQKRYRYGAARHQHSGEEGC